MQRRRHISNLTYINIRNISAHAEKTKSFQVLFTSQLKHLCACREDCGQEDLRRVAEGNISAHAEKTDTKPPRELLHKKHLCACREDYNSLRLALSLGKHLCACREDDSLGGDKIMNSETSLRMQRRPSTKINCLSGLRNISAHAEKTMIAIASPCSS